MARMILLCSFVLAAFGQSRPAVTPEVTAANLPANLPAQKIGPNDLISVAVYEAPEFSRTVRVGADGFIRLPMVRNRIQAEERLPAELEVAVAAALQEEELILDPFVTVAILEYQSRPISVAGAVRKPVTFQAAETMTLLEALARAEGLGPDAGSEILISRPVKKGAAPGEPHYIQRIPVKGLIDEADPELNVLLHGGEEIRVPDVGRVFVVGNVRKPGAFPLRDAGETSVLKLLALSEGLLPYANKQAFIYRREASGTKNEIQIELKQIMDRKAPDVPLLADDVLYVPDATGRRAAMNAIERLVLFGSTAGATALIWRTR
ncbi:MAG: SLBB domain-containing protein [Bryobacterales bacterium]|nr:SLBB domain-containing protein [Bryobacterales bacterium]